MTKLSSSLLFFVAVTTVLCSSDVQDNNVVTAAQVTTSPVISGDTQIMAMNNETSAATNDTYITFWTPIYTYMDKIPKYLAKIPGLKYPMSMVTMLTANLVSLAIVAATAFMSFFFSPNTIKIITKLTENLANFSTMSPAGVEDLARRVNLAVESYGKIDPEVCLRMASCTLGKERKRKEAGSASGSFYANANNIWNNGTSANGQKQIHPMLMGIQLLDNWLR